jgi:hypothetical protein
LVIYLDDMSLFVQLYDGNGNVLSVAESTWTTLDPATVPVTIETLFYFVPQSQTLISANMVAEVVDPNTGARKGLKGERVYGGWEGLVEGGGTSAIPQVHVVLAGSTSAYIQVKGSTTLYLKPSATTPGSGMTYTTDKYLWTMKGVVPAFYIRTNTLAYVKYDSASGKYSLVATPTDATAFESMNGNLFLHGSFNWNNGTPTAGVMGVQTTNTISPVETNLSTLIILSNTSFVREKQNHFTLGGTPVTFDPTLGLVPSVKVGGAYVNTCVIEQVDSVFDPTNLIVYQWPFKALNGQFPYQNIPAPPPAVQPTTSKTTKYVLITLAALIGVAIVVVIAVLVSRKAKKPRKVQ